jgi:uncharacterized protein
LSTTVLIHPGWGDSTAEHWQSLWEKERSDVQRVQQREWLDVNRDEWIATLDDYVQNAPGQVVLVGHSTSNVLINHWAQQKPADKIKAALLVAPTDAENHETCPPQLWQFGPVPMYKLPFPTIVVASENDPYCTLPRAEKFANAWGSELVNIGQAGHINVASGFGPFPQGKLLLERLIGLP